MRIILIYYIMGGRDSVGSGASEAKSLPVHAHVIAATLSRLPSSYNDSCRAQVQRFIHQSVKANNLGLPWMETVSALVDKVRRLCLPTPPLPPDTPFFIPTFYSLFIPTFYSLFYSHIFRLYEVVLPHTCVLPYIYPIRPRL